MSHTSSSSVTSTPLLYLETCTNYEPLHYITALSVPLLPPWYKLIIYIQDGQCLVAPCRNVSKIKFQFSSAAEPYERQQMPAITPLNAGLLPVSGHTDVSQQGRQRTERARDDFQQRFDQEAPSQNRHFCDGSMNSLCDRQYHPCAKWLKMNGALPPPPTCFRGVHENSEPPPRRLVQFTAESKAY